MRRPYRLAARCAGALLACAAMACLPHAAPKKDVVMLLNGDRINGEIKGLEHERRRWSTDHVGTLQVAWDKIPRITSTQYLQCERSDGSRGVVTSLGCGF